MGVIFEQRSKFIDEVLIGTRSVPGKGMSDDPVRLTRRYNPDTDSYGLVVQQVTAGDRPTGAAIQVVGEATIPLTAASAEVLRRALKELESAGTAEA